MELDKKSFYKEETMRFFECDKFGNAKIETLLRYIADISGIDYTEKGYSHKFLWDNGMVFLVSRVSIRFYRIPKAEEKVIFETWENKTKGVLFFRNFNMWDKDGNKIGEASTAWVLVNPITRSILRPTAFEGEVSPNPEKDVEVLPVGKIKIEKEIELKEIGKHTIVYSDVDGNQHTYNARYAGMSMDFLPEKYLEKEVTDFRIDFKSEATLGETLVIKMQEVDNKVIVIGELPDRISYECEFTFK